MRNILGNSLTLTLFGESHGKQIGVVIDGIKPGYQINDNLIKEKLHNRRPNSNETSRIEEDHYEIISGVFNGLTTGAPLTIIIDNDNVKSGDYHHVARPSHVDYAANVKYNGFEDYRGGGHFSGRITAPIVAAGAIIEDILKQKGISIGSSIAQIGDLMNPSNEQINQLFAELNQNHNSVGGKINVNISGVPAGVGEPWFSSFEGELSKAMFAIGGVKGIEFGDGFDFINKLGNQVQDNYEIDKSIIKTNSNHNGGINGGISNGNDISFNLAIKPTPSFNQEMKLLDLNKNEICVDTLNGRFDCCIVRRIMPVAESLTAFVVYDLLQIKFGTEYFIN